MIRNEHNSAAKILIVHDELQIARSLHTTLSAEGYLLRIACNGIEGMNAVHAWKPDLVIADLFIPQMSGLELCRKTRAVSKASIIVVTGRDDDLIKIEALDAGADDCVTEPFNIKELQARIRARLRRNSPMISRTPEIIRIGDFLIDIPRHRVSVRGRDTRLTPKLFDLLLYMTQNPEQLLTHRTLFHAVWNTNVDQPESLRVAIAQLRKKIEISNQPAYIVTEPRVGYRFLPTVISQST